MNYSITIDLDYIYNFFNENLKEGEGIFTPREISHLALIAYNKNKDGIDTNLFEIAYKYYGSKLSLLGRAEYKEKYSISNAEIDKEEFCLKGDFERIEYKDSEGKDKIYEIVPSRIEVFSIIEDMMHLRKLRMDQKPTDANWPSKAGQFGMILEGVPKTGKSEIIRASFSKQGLKEGEDWLYLPVSMQNDTKRTFLTKALEEGKIVMIDELNSVALDEEFMNQILDGKTKHPGFTILATQNFASSMKGRCNIPEALSSRMMKQEVPDYTKAEKRHIFGFDETNIEIDELCSAIYNNLLEKDQLKNFIESASKQKILDQKNQFGQSIFEVAKEAENIDAIIMLSKNGLDLPQEMVEYISGQACRHFWEGNIELASQLTPFADPDWHNEYDQTIGDVAAIKGIQL